MIVGARKALFMDEILTGLDSSTTFQIVKCIRNFVHQMDAAVLMALLQPAPETFNLFDDLLLLLPVVYKQRGNLFYPRWAWSLATWILGVPYSIVESVIWSCIVYYSVGFAPAPGRFFRYMFLPLMIHQMALGLLRFMASLARNMVIANTFGSAALMIIFLLGGFIIPKGLLVVTSYLWTKRNFSQ
ncbi:ABC transporter G family member 31 [Glycine soja]|uniref:ABC transporter G family member 31 n=1 Tax=Glycine soja TaxID=3848 RepID=A0A0B2P4T6_GLYSO|nr:ABC transporter G family member 31 [Glycine soja]